MNEFQMTKLLRPVILSEAEESLFFIYHSVIQEELEIRHLKFPFGDCSLIFRNRFATEHAETDLIKH